ncbi:MAG: GNAT family N-acetyltransferase [Thermoplasmata archaeon]|nr:GNAT family N-acetyltransferase [Thermoplasmata archaeon]
MTALSPPRRIRPTDWSALRELRLDALAADPLAFGSTFERESELPETHWRTRAETSASGAGETIVLVEPVDGSFAGMVGAFSAGGAKVLWGMWVRPEHRHRGVGVALLEAVLGWCREAASHEPVRLDVNPSQSSAVRLYERHQFRFTGDERALGHHAPARTLGMEWVPPPRPPQGPG